MSKIKVSFSLFFTIFLVGILATGVFASSNYMLTPTTNAAGSFDVSFHGLDNTTDPVGTSFTVLLKDGSTVVETQVGTLTSTLDHFGRYSGSVSFTTAVTKNKTYTVELYRTADTTTLLETAYALFQDSKNGPMATTTNPDGSVTVDQSGNGLNNANATGKDNKVKARTGQKVHGFYQNNTNSCASCHQTHTGSDSRSTGEQALLFKDGVYSTCSACHDGTTGAYNSFAPVSANQVNTISGTFNVQTTGHNGSLHEADGSLQVAAAPAGNKDATSKEYGQQFDCASCHAAHGAGSNGENNLNVDPLGWGSVAFANLPAGTDLTTATSAQKDALNGKLFNNVKIYDLTKTPADTIPTAYDMTGQNAAAGSTPYILVKFTATASDASSFWYQRAGVQAGDLVLQTYRWDGSKYARDYSLWLQELGYPFKANTKLMDSTGKDITRGGTAKMQVVFRDAFAYGQDVANVASANISIGIDVETPVKSDMASLYDNTDKNYVPDSGVEMSKYCASCHVDYLSTTRKNVSGIYTQAHRHATGIDETTCVRCHYAHGSEANIMKDANENTYYSLTAAGKVFDASVAGNTDKALSYFVDPNPSSALKRYTGMSVCYACHGKGEQFIGNPNTNQADTTTGQYLMNGNPGDTGATGSVPGDGRTDLTPNTK